MKEAVLSDCGKIAGHVEAHLVRLLQRVVVVDESGGGVHLVGHGLEEDAGGRHLGLWHEEPMVKMTTIRKIQTHDPHRYGVYMYLSLDPKLKILPQHYLIIKFLLNSMLQYFK